MFGIREKKERKKMEREVPKAIETEYKGYRFRSRLEARWAVFFDCMGVEWEYEPEGFDLGDGLFYLPDFRLKNVLVGGWKQDVLYAEIKGELNDDDRVKIESFAKTHPLVVLGNFPHDVDYSVWCSCDEKGAPLKYVLRSSIWESIHGELDFTIHSDPCDYDIIEECYSCHAPYLEVEYNSFPIDISQTTNLSNAIKTAKQARFEHGESPIIKHYYGQGLAYSDGESQGDGTHAYNMLLLCWYLYVKELSKYSNQKYHIHCSIDDKTILISNIDTNEEIIIICDAPYGKKYLKQLKNNEFAARAFGVDDCGLLFCNTATPTSLYISDKGFFVSNSISDDNTSRFYPFLRYAIFKHVYESICKNGFVIPDFGQHKSYGGYADSYVNDFCFYLCGFDKCGVYANIPTKERKEEKK